MKKSLLFYKIFMPTTLGLAFLALTFNILSLLITFDMNIGNIKVGHPLAILLIVFISLALAMPIVLSVLAKETKIITRTKRGSLFHKIAAAILALSLAAVTAFDFVILVKELVQISNVLNSSGALKFSEAFSQYFEIARLIRVFLAIPFIAYLVFEIIDRNSKKLFALKCACNSMAILWCALTPIVFYFFNGSPPIGEYLRVTYSVAFIIVTIFFLYDFKWNYLETSFRAYMPITTIASSFSLILSVASIVAVIARRDCLIITNYWDFLSGKSTFKYGIFDIYSINIFEMILVLAFGLFALAKIVSIIQTVSAVAKSENEKKSK